jgi:hypothetical protein
MTTRVKARRPLGLLALVAATAFFILSANSAAAEGNGPPPQYSATVHGTCESWAITITNNTEQDIEVSITLNGTVITAEVEGESHTTVPLEFYEDIPNTLLVTVGERILLQKTFSVSCFPDPRAELSASISSDCGNFVVTVKNDGDAPGTATITVNGSPVTITVDGGKTETMTAVLTEDADNTITVTAGDTELAHKAFYVNCKETPVPPTTAPPTTVPPVPAVEVLSETVQAPQPQTLAFTGRNTVIETFVGVFLLGFGLHLMRSSRRLEQS